MSAECETCENLPCTCCCREVSECRCPECRPAPTQLTPVRVPPCEVTSALIYAAAECVRMAWEPDDMIDANKADRRRLAAQAEFRLRAACDRLKAIADRLKETGR